MASCLDFPAMEAGLNLGLSDGQFTDNLFIILTVRFLLQCE